MSVLGTRVRRVEDPNVLTTGGVSLANPLGAKGIGESGTIGATPAVHNAVIDALAHLGVRHFDMPTTAGRVWNAIDGAADATAGVA